MTCGVLFATDESMTAVEAARSEHTASAAGNVPSQTSSLPSALHIIHSLFPKHFHSAPHAVSQARAIHVSHFFEHTEQLLTTSARQLEGLVLQGPLLDDGMNSLTKSSLQCKTGLEVLPTSQRYLQAWTVLSRDLFAVTSLSCQTQDRTFFVVLMLMPILRWIYVIPRDLGHAMLVSMSSPKRPPMHGA